jgi:S1-C subfamily serine protease
MMNHTTLKAMAAAVAVAICLAAVPAEAHASGDVLGVWYRTAPRGDGVEVTGVLSGSEAERIGLEVGDRILTVNGQPIRSKADFRRAMEDTGPAVRLRIRNVRTGGVAFRTAYLR